jgi:beta-N-acetylhexosaminidase
LAADCAAPAGRRPRALILGCTGERLDTAERSFFTAADPLGFILFRRNCVDPVQVRDLVAALRDSVGRPQAPVLIDQEGGRVARLGPPGWRSYPAAAQIAALPDPLAEEAAWLGARLIADDLAALGITVDCLPVLDLAIAGADPVIGDRAYGSEPERIIRLARAVSAGLLDGGVLPVVKHIPGHGRARIDSHFACPVVDTPRAEMSRSDFVPFRALAHLPWGMTAHIVYAAIDQSAPATLSPRVVGEIIRGEIGFAGVLVSDDLSMRALDGDLAERARRALFAGCDLVLHCNGDRREMEAVAAATTPISLATAARLERGEAMRRPAPLAPEAPPWGDASKGARAGFDRGAAEARFAALFAGGDA